MAANPLEGHSERLRELARRVRHLREVAGLTQAQLAERARLSVRFLARIEAGDGNVSVSRLADLADALGTTPSDLLRPRPEHPMFVALVGLRGAGKSTVGPLLASALRLPFVEMDDLIREDSGLPLDQLFELHGERYYRTLEHDTVRRLLAGGDPCVLAAAGGVVTEPATWRLLLRSATVVWLRATPEEHWNRVVAQGDRRPMDQHPDAMAEMRRILAAREPTYRQAQLTVDTTSRPPEEIVAEIVRRTAPIRVH